jgi:hypothetical protein
MRKSNSIQLSIPTPCSQDWDEMTINDKGRFCGNCSKSVIDFTNYSDQQIVDFFIKSKEDICGQFKSDQLEKPLHPLQQEQSGSFMQLLINGMLAIGLGSGLSANKKHTEPLAIYGVVDVDQKEKKDNFTTVGDTCNFISGTVIDQATKETLPGVTILIEGITTATASDVNGFFKLPFPNHLSGKPIELTFSYIGYKSQLMRYRPETPVSDLIIELREDRTVTRDVVIRGRAIPSAVCKQRSTNQKGITIESRSSFKQKIKRWFEK